MKLYEAIKDMRNLVDFTVEWYANGVAIEVNAKEVLFGYDSDGKWFNLITREVVEYEEAKEWLIGYTKSKK